MAYKKYPTYQKSYPGYDQSYPGYPTYQYPGYTKPIKKSYLSDYNNPYELNSLADIVLTTFNPNMERNDWGGLEDIPGVNILTGLADFYDERIIKPISEGKFVEAGLNQLMNLGETLDVVASPVKAAVQGKNPMDAMGWGNNGRQNFDYNTGNFFSDMGLEIISDPLNWISFGGKAVISGLAKGSVEAFVKQSLKEGAEGLTDAARNKLVKSLTKQALSNFTEGSLKKQGLTKFQEVIEATIKNNVDAKYLNDVGQLAFDDLNIALLQGLNNVVQTSEAFEKALLKSVLFSPAYKPLGYLIKNGKVDSVRSYVVQQMRAGWEMYNTPTGLRDIFKIDDMKTAFQERAYRLNQLLSDEDKFNDDLYKMILKSDFKKIENEFWGVLKLNLRDNPDVGADEFLQLLQQQFSKVIMRTEDVPEHLIDLSHIYRFIEKLETDDIAKTGKSKYTTLKNIVFNKMNFEPKIIEINKQRQYLFDTLNVIKELQEYKGFTKTEKFKALQEYIQRTTKMTPEEFTQNFKTIQAYEKYLLDNNAEYIVKPMEYDWFIDLLESPFKETQIATLKRFTNQLFFETKQESAAKQLAALEEFCQMSFNKSLDEFIQQIAVLNETEDGIAQEFYDRLTDQVKKLRAYKEIEEDFDKTVLSDLDLKIDIDRLLDIKEKTLNVILGLPSVITNHYNKVFQGSAKEQYTAINQAFTEIRIKLGLNKTDSTNAAYVSIIDNYLNKLNTHINNTVKNNAEFNPDSKYVKSLQNSAEKALYEQFDKDAPITKLTPIVAGKPATGGPSLWKPFESLINSITAGNWSKKDLINVIGADPEDILRYTENGVTKYKLVPAYDFIKSKKDFSHAYNNLVVKHEEFLFDMREFKSSFLESLETAVEDSRVQIALADNIYFAEDFSEMNTLLTNFFQLVDNFEDQLTAAKLSKKDRVVHPAQIETFLIGLTRTQNMVKKQLNKIKHYTEQIGTPSNTPVLYDKQTQRVIKTLVDKIESLQTILTDYDIQAKLQKTRKLLSNEVTYVLKLEQMYITDMILHDAQFDTVVKNVLDYTTPNSVGFQLTRLRDLIYSELENSLSVRYEDIRELGHQMDLAVKTHPTLQLIDRVLNMAQGYENNKELFKAINAAAQYDAETGEEWAKTIKSTIENWARTNPESFQTTVQDKGLLYYFVKRAELHYNSTVQEESFSLQEVGKRLGFAEPQIHHAKDDTELLQKVWDKDEFLKAERDRLERQGHSLVYFDIETGGLNANVFQITQGAFTSNVAELNTGDMNIQITQHIPLHVQAKTNIIPEKHNAQAGLMSEEQFFINTAKHLDAHLKNTKLFKAKDGKPPSVYLTTHNGKEFDIPTMQRRLKVLMEKNQNNPKMLEQLQQASKTWSSPRIKHQDSLVILKEHNGWKTMPYRMQAYLKQVFLNHADAQIKSNNKYILQPLDLNFFKNLREIYDSDLKTIFSQSDIDSLKSANPWIDNLHDTPLGSIKDIVDETYSKFKSMRQQNLSYSEIEIPATIFDLPYVQKEFGRNLQMILGRTIDDQGIKRMITDVQLGGFKTGTNMLLINEYQLLKQNPAFTYDSKTVQKATKRAKEVNRIVEQLEYVKPIEDLAPQIDTLYGIVMRAVSKNETSFAGYIQGMEALPSGTHNVIQKYALLQHMYNWTYDVLITNTELEKGHYINIALTNEDRIQLRKVLDLLEDPSVTKHHDYPQEGFLYKEFNFDDYADYYPAYTTKIDYTIESSYVNQLYDNAKRKQQDMFAALSEGTVYNRDEIMQLSWNEIQQLSYKQDTIDVKNIQSDVYKAEQILRIYRENKGAFIHAANLKKALEESKLNFDKMLYDFEQLSLSLDENGVISRAVLQRQANAVYNVRALWDFLQTKYEKLIADNKLHFMDETEDGLFKAIVSDPVANEILYNEHVKTKLYTDNFAQQNLMQVLGLSDVQLFNHLVNEGRRVIVFGKYDFLEQEWYEPAIRNYLSRANDLKKLGIHIVEDKFGHVWTVLDNTVKIDLDQDFKYVNGILIPGKQLKELNHDVASVIFEDAEQAAAFQRARQSLMGFSEMDEMPGSLGVPYSKSLAKNLYQKMPNEIRALLPEEEIFLAESNFKYGMYNHSVLGSLTTQRDFIPNLAGDIQSIYRNTAKYHADHASTRVQYMQMFDEFSPYNIKTGVFQNIPDEDLLKLVQTSHEYKLAILIKDKKHGARIVQIMPTSIDDIKYAKSMNAIWMTNQTYSTAVETINKFSVTHTAIKIYQQIIFAYKVGYLSSIGGIFRNLIDSTLKNYVATGDPVGMTEAYIDAMHLLPKYYECERAIIRTNKNGKLGIDPEFVTEYFASGHSALDRETYEFIHGFIEDGVSAGESKLRQQMYLQQIGESHPIKQKYDRLTKLLLTPNKEVEQVQRLGLYLWAVKKQGYSNTKAYDLISRVHFDYNLKTNADRMAELILPFYTFKMRNIEFWIDQIEQHPWIANLFNDAMIPVFNFDGNSHEELKKNRSLQYQILAGNIPLDNTGLTLKTNLSIMDVYNTIQNPIDTGVNGLAQPIKALFNAATNAINQQSIIPQDPIDALGIAPLIGPAIQRYGKQGPTYYERTGNPVNQVLPDVFGATLRYKPRSTNKKRGRTYSAKPTRFYPKRSRIVRAEIPRNMYSSLYSKSGKSRVANQIRFATSKNKTRMSGVISDFTRPRYYLKKNGQPY